MSDESTAPTARKRTKERSRLCPATEPTRGQKAERRIEELTGVKAYAGYGKYAVMLGIDCAEKLIELAIAGAESLALDAEVDALAAEEMAADPTPGPDDDPFSPDDNPFG